MNCALAFPAHLAAALRRPTLSSATAFFLLASITVSFLAGSSAPTPLYPLYQAEWGFSPITVTVVFGIYVLALLAALLILGAVWALAGFYASLGPGLIHRVFGLDSSLLGGAALFVLAASGGGAVLALRSSPPRTAMRFGAATLVGGVALVVAALSFRSAALFFIGTAVAGVGFGAGFQGAVRSVVAVAAPGESAGVLSLIFVISYLAMGLPAVVAGGLVALDGSLLATAQQFGAFVMVLAGLALWGASSRRPH